MRRAVWPARTAVHHCKRFGKEDTAKELQDLVADGSPLYVHVAEAVARWGGDEVGECGLSAVGAVVGVPVGAPRRCDAARAVLHPLRAEERHGADMALASTTVWRSVRIQAVFPLSVRCVATARAPKQEGQG